MFGALSRAKDATVIGVFTSILVAIFCGQLKQRVKIK